MHFRYARSYRGPLQGIILDWAGTTMDFGCFAPAVVFKKVYERFDVPITVEEARLPMGAHKRDHIQQIARIPAVRRRWTEVHGQPPRESDIDAMFAEFVPLQMDCLADYADLVPGALQAVDAFRARGLSIGSTTGYTGEMMALLREEAARRGYEPDVSVCATDVPQGRPAPWMCVKNAMEMGIYPFEALVKVGDTLPDIEEGLNAGMWTVGLATSGNEMGLTPEQLDALDPQDRDHRRERARRRMLQTGAHYVVDTIAHVPALLDRIDERLARGERP